MNDLSHQLKMFTKNTQRYVQGVTAIVQLITQWLHLITTRLTS